MPVQDKKSVPEAEIIDLAAVFVLLLSLRKARNYLGGNIVPKICLSDAKHNYICMCAVKLIQRPRKAK